MGDMERQHLLRWIQRGRPVQMGRGIRLRRSGAKRVQSLRCILVGQGDEGQMGASRSSPQHRGQQRRSHSATRREPLDGIRQLHRNK